MPLRHVFNRRNNRLAYRLVFLMVLSSSLLSVMATCIQLYSSYQRDKHLLVTETFDVIESSFQGSLESALWAFNFHQVESVLDGILANGSISSIELVTTTGHSWQRGEDAIANASNSRAFNLIQRAEDRPPEPLGTLTIGLTFEEIQDRIWAQFWTLFLSNLTKTFLASLIMLLLFHRLVVRHLRDTARFVDSANWMEHQQPLHLDRRDTDDDLDKIAKAINGAKARVLADVEQLQRANAELVRSNRQLDDFAYIASHDLKEPLRGIYNHAGFLLEDYEHRLEEDGIQRLRRLVKLSQRLERLIADLLYFSRLGRGDQAIEPVDLVSVLHGIEAQHADFISQRNALIILGDDLPKVLGQRAHVETIFRNLITNGIKYNDADQKMIEIGNAGERRDSKESGHSTFYVKDNGIGIDEQFKDEVFRIFKRLKSEKAYGEGTGAGLTFVKQIIESHGGNIWFTSTLGEGTTFFFSLPLAEASSASIPRKRAA